MTQLIFRVMRVTLSEWAGDVVPALKNMHVSTIISMILTILLVLTGTWVYLWQLFGAANQLMAALSLLIVTSGCESRRRIPSFALWPTLFMYITTLAATLVTARNLYVTIVPQRRLGRGRRLGDDRDRHPAVRDRPDHRLGWLPGLPALLRKGGKAQKAPAAAD